MGNLSFEKYDITMDLRDDYTSLVTRSKGRELTRIFLERLEKAKEGDTLILDFELVTNIDFSFLDAFLLPVLRRHQNGKLGNRYLVGLNLDQTMLNKLVRKDGLCDKLKQENLIFAVCTKGGDPYWLGSTDKRATQIMNYLWNVTKASFDRIALQFDIPNTECSQILRYLVGHRVLRVAKTKVQKALYYHPIIEKALWRKLTRPISEEIHEMIENLEAIEVGCHYEMPSGQHAEEFLHLSKVLGSSRFMSKIARKIVDVFGKNIDVVLTTGIPTNIVVAQKIADLSGGDTQSVFANLSERGDHLTLKEGFNITGKKVLILVDVLGSGTVTSLLIRLAKEKHAIIRGTCCIVDTSGGITNFPSFKMLKLSWLEKPLRTFNSRECPLCKKGVPIKTARILPRRT
ncbi:hypothetical protein GTO27_12935 [Candidatus Bathyarchaeota archaeon]|nr:hypothetical protein [Candidatus Bathyarchaeota archaeon]